MVEIDAVSDDFDVFNYPNGGEKTSTVWNSRTVSLEGSIGNSDKRIAKIYEDSNYNTEQLLCMSRCTTKRNTEWGVIVKRDKEGNTSGGMELSAPSEDGKDIIEFDLHVDSEGKVSGEASYRYNTGPSKRDK